MSLPPPENPLTSNSREREGGGEGGIATGTTVQQAAYPSCDNVASSHRVTAESPLPLFLPSIDPAISDVIGTPGIHSSKDTIEIPTDIFDLHGLNKCIHQSNFSVNSNDSKFCSRVEINAHDRSNDWDGPSNCGPEGCCVTIMEVDSVADGGKLEGDKTGAVTTFPDRSLAAGLNKGSLLPNAEVQGEDRMCEGPSVTPLSSHQNEKACLDSAMSVKSCYSVEPSSGEVEEDSSMLGRRLILDDEATAEDVSISILTLPSDSLHGIASYLTPSEWREFSSTSRQSHLICSPVFHRVRIHGLKCATEVVSSWLSGQHSDAKELAALYLASGVPIYPSCQGHSYRTLTWRMRAEAKALDRASLRENGVSAPVDRFLSRRFSSTLGGRAEERVAPSSGAQSIDRFYVERNALRERRLVSISHAHAVAAAVHAATAQDRHRHLFGALDPLPRVGAAGRGRFSGFGHHHLPARLSYLEEKCSFWRAALSTNEEQHIAKNRQILSRHQGIAERQRSMIALPNSLILDLQDAPLDPALLQRSRSGGDASVHHRRHSSSPDSASFQLRRSNPRMEVKCHDHLIHQHELGMCSVLDILGRGSLEESAGRDQASNHMGNVDGGGSGTDIPEDTLLVDPCEISLSADFYHPQRRQARNCGLAMGKSAESFSTGSIDRLGSSPVTGHHIGHHAASAAWPGGNFDEMGDGRFARQTTRFRQRSEDTTQLSALSAPRGRGLNDGEANRGPAAVTYYGNDVDRAMVEEFAEDMMNAGVDNGHIPFTRHLLHDCSLDGHQRQRQRRDYRRSGVSLRRSLSLGTFPVRGTIEDRRSGAAASPLRDLDFLQNVSVQSYNASIAPEAVRDRFRFYRDEMARVIFSSRGKLNDIGADLDLLLFQFWDDFFRQTRFVSHFDGHTAVPRLDPVALRAFLSKPCPKSMGIMQCEIERIRVKGGSNKKKPSSGGVKGRFFPQYEYRLFIRDRKSSWRDSLTGRDAIGAELRNGNRGSSEIGDTNSSEYESRNVVLMTARNRGKNHTNLLSSPSYQIPDGYGSASETFVHPRHSQQQGSKKSKRGVNNYFLYMANSIDNKWNRQCSTCTRNIGVKNLDEASSLELGRLQSNLLGTEFQIHAPATKNAPPPPPFVGRSVKANHLSRSAYTPPAVAKTSISKCVSPSSTLPTSPENSLSTSRDATSVCASSPLLPGEQIHAFSDDGQQSPSPLRMASLRRCTTGGDSIVCQRSDPVKRSRNASGMLSRRGSWPGIIGRSRRTNRRAIAHDASSVSSGSNGAIGPSAADEFNDEQLFHQWEVENGAITYTANLLGNRPRIMDVCIPKLPPLTYSESASNARDSRLFGVTPAIEYALEGEWERYRERLIREGQYNPAADGNLILSKFRLLQDRLNSARTNNNINNIADHGPNNHDENRNAGVNDAFGENDSHTTEGENFGLLALQNRPPWWNTELGAFVLNFGGRVSVASVKNFQLCDRNDQEYIMLQFGRIQGRHAFTMDFQYPLSAMQAFAIAISSLQSKISLG